MIDATSRLGLLSSEPLPELLGALARDRQTCVIRLALASGPAEVYLREGMAVAVELPGHIDRLGDLLASGGAIDQETLLRTVASPRLPGQRYGRLLVESGLVPESKLQAALRLQVRRRLHRLFFTDEGEFVVEAGAHDRGDSADRLAVDLRPVIMLGVRSGWTEARYGSRLPSTPLRLAVELAQLAPYQLQPTELQLLEPMSRGPCTVTQLVVSANDGNSAHVRPTVYGLLAAGAIVRDGATAAPPLSERAGWASGVPAAPLTTDESSPWISRPTRPPTAAAARGSSPPSAAPRSPSPSTSFGPVPPGAVGPPPPTQAGRPSSSPTLGVPLATRSGTSGPSSATGLEAAARTISDKRASVEAEDLFAVLGVSRDAGKGEIKAAYLEAARIYHPDRLAGAGLLHLREAAEFIFRRVSEAHAILTDEDRRAGYIERLDTPPELLDAQARAQRLVAAEMSLMEGDVALKRRDFPSAIERLSESVQLNPDLGEAIALLAWARFSAGQAGLLEQRADFERAVAKSPQCARAHYYLGMVRKQARESMAAISSFRRAADLDPRLAEAASELRVLSLRATRELPTLQRPKGLLDRLLNKK